MLGLPLQLRPLIGTSAPDRRQIRMPAIGRAVGVKITESAPGSKGGPRCPLGFQTWDAARRAH
jgi:hypothetical protein